MNTQSSPPDLDFCSGLLCIELDNQSSQSLDKTPPLLVREAANALAGHIADDLDRLLDEGIAPAGLVLAGALYDQTDIFRPGFPLLTALADLMRRAPRNNGLPPPRLALGASGDRFPIAALNPQPQSTFGPLALLPFCLVGPGEVMDRLYPDMENNLAQGGEPSEATRAAVQTQFNIPILNLFYATLGDLCAWLRTQLEDNDLQGLWQLLEPALFERPGPHQVILTDSGNRYLLADDAAWVPFYTFDDWARFGPGRTVAADQLEAAYRRWLRQFRLYAVALPAYGLPLHIVVGSPAIESDEVSAAMVAVRSAATLNEDYLVETVYTLSGNRQPARLLATQQGDEELDVIAYSLATLADDGQLLSLEHFYPLHAAGLEAIVKEIERRSEHYGIPHTIQQTGWLVYSPADRCLGAVDDHNQALIAPRA
ncbi:MAG: hypothetical protein QG599_2019 [Pseudomonadota bacterium]|nr:hypothetical protein [Pseudomonadota bacterium]